MFIKSSLRLCLCLIFVAACKKPVRNTVHFAPVSFTVEIAETDLQRSIGLMNRTHLEPNCGMIFIWPDEQHRSFWMKNTLIPLDMIFMDKDKKIVGIVHRAAPNTLTQRSVGKPSQYVLEINAGLAEHYQLQVGDSARWSF